MKRNELLGAFFAAVFFVWNFSAAAEITPAAQKAVDDFMGLRMKIAGLGAEQALAQVSDFEKKLAIDSTFSAQEDRLVLVNFIVMEKYNFLRRQKGTKDQLKKNAKRAQGKERGLV